MLKTLQSKVNSLFPFGLLKYEGLRFYSSVISNSLIENTSDVFINVNVLVIFGIFIWLPKLIKREVSGVINSKMNPKMKSGKIQGKKRNKNCESCKNSKKRSQNKNKKKKKRKK